MQKVRFTKSHDGYNPGEIAGFEESAAEKLVAQGVAELTDLDEQPEPTKDVEHIPEEGSGGRGGRRRGAEE